MANSLKDNVLFSDNAYNKFSIDKYINIRYNSIGFDEYYQERELGRFSNIIRELNSQISSQELDSEDFNESLELIKELYSYTNVGELNPEEIPLGQMPAVMPTQITDKDAYLDIVLLEKFSKALNYWVTIGKIENKNPKIIYGNPLEIVEVIEGYYQSQFDEKDKQGVSPESKEYKDLMAQYTHFKSYVMAYDRIVTKKERDKYDKEVYSDKYKSLKQDADLGVIGLADEYKVRILAERGLIDKDVLDDDSRAEQSATSNDTGSKGTFYYDMNLKDYVTDRNDTHSKVRSLLRSSGVGDIDEVSGLSFTTNTSDPIKTLVEAKKQTERRAAVMEQMPAAVRKQYKDYVALPYRWLIAKLDRPITLINELNSNKEQIVVHHLGIMLSEAFVKEPSEDNKDGQLHLQEGELEQKKASSRPKTEIYGVFRKDKQGRISQNVVFANIDDEYILQNKEFFRDVFFSNELMELVQERNAGYAGTVSQEGNDYRINFNGEDDFIRVGALKFAELTTDKAMIMLESMGYDKEVVERMINRFTQGEVVNVRSDSSRTDKSKKFNYDEKGKKRLISTVERMKKRQMDYILLDDVKSQNPGITEHEAAEIVKNNRERLIGTSIDKKPIKPRADRIR